MSHEQLYDHLYNKNVLTDQVKAALEDYFNSKKSSKKVQFGKYKGKSVADIAIIDEKYLRWLLKQKWLFDDIREEIENMHLE